MGNLNVVITKNLVQCSMLKVILEYYLETRNLTFGLVRSAVIWLTVKL